MNLFLDCEFTALEQNGKLISLALVAETGQTFYAEFTDFSVDQLSDWHKQNVIQHLSFNDKEPFVEIHEANHRVKADRDHIRVELEKFLSQFDKIEIWGDNHAYDWVFVCQLFGGALHMPKHIHYIVQDIATLFKSHGYDADISRMEFAYKGTTEEYPQHHALGDALALLKCWQILTNKTVPQAGETTHSYHLFLFPFQWDCRQKDKSLRETDYGQRINMQCWASDNGDENVGLFERNRFILGNETNVAADYNEYTYFYKFIRDSLYDDGEKDGQLNYYSINEKHCKGGTYTIEILPDLNKPLLTNKYELDVKSIGLHIFKTGVGILSFNLENTRYSEPGDILRINEYGRRIYPQFLGSKGLQSTKNAFLADKTTLSIPAIGINNIWEDFSFYKTGENTGRAITLKNVFKLPAYISVLFQGTGVSEKEDDGDSKIFISPVMDDRMFTLCWYGNNSVGRKLKSVNNGEQCYNYEFNDWWYCFVFGDAGGPSCANKFLKRKHTQEHTYARWIEYGTLYGVTSETFMALSNDIPAINNNNAPPVHDHMRTLYYQLVNLCLVQRASMLRFSDEVTRFKGANLSNDNIKLLYWNYIEFINKIYFREVTAQIQGIELYNKLQDAMNLKEHVKDLDSEIEELHNYVSMQEAGLLTKQQTQLTRVATFFLPASLIVGILGMSMMDKDHSHFFGLPSDREAMNAWFWIAFILLTSIAFVRFYPHILAGLQRADEILTTRSLKKQKTIKTKYNTKKK